MVAHNLAEAVDSNFLSTGLRLTDKLWANSVSLGAESSMTICALELGLTGESLFAMIQKINVINKSNNQFKCMTNYEHHIFISYRRSDAVWMRWARENVAGGLRTLLRPALGDVKIFVDEQIETGTRWPDRLARALARSRLLIPLLSRDYFNSEWCRLELALMLHREQQCQFRCSANTAVLIIPFVYDDGECFPVEVKSLTFKNIHEYANPFVRTDCPAYIEITEMLRMECPRLIEAVNSAPPFNPDWEMIAYDQFRDLFQIQAATQSTLPSLSMIALNRTSNAT
jgi:hypothetical protein